MRHWNSIVPRIPRRTLTKTARMTKSIWFVPCSSKKIAWRITGRISRITPTKPLKPGMVTDSVLKTTTKIIRKRSVIGQATGRILVRIWVRTLNVYIGNFMKSWLRLCLYW